MKRANRIKSAIREAKKRYENQCIVTGLGYPDGAHIIPRDVRPDLADNIDNIIPLAREAHRLLDQLPDRDHEARFTFLLEITLPENLGRVKKQIDELRRQI